MTGEELREQLFKKLQEIFGENNVQTKWRASADSSDDFNSISMYTPETDISIGPWNIRGWLELDNQKINETLNLCRNFLDRINQIAEKKFDEDYLNNNPRCFIAIEVGGSGSRKHFLGDMFNASILGKIGIVVGKDDEKTMIYKRIFEYVNFAYNVGKTKQHFENVAILNGVRFLDLLKKEEKYLAGYKNRQSRKGRG